MELMMVFVRVGIPTETDQEMSFMSQLMKNICELLKNQVSRSSVYYPQKMD